MSMICPRCSRPVDQEFYGPCPTCREQLCSTLAGEAREIVVADYEPKMNVAPNAVASKE